MKTKEHYDNHLGKFYSWMIGDFDTRANEQFMFFKSHAILPHDNRLAIDLGCGNGIQSIALAKLGFNVNAIDFNQQLLSELHKRIDNHPITIHQTDILNFEETIENQAEFIGCMGDTISHFSSIDEIRKIIKTIYSKLTDSGKIVLSFRDYSVALNGENRFIPVKSDDHQILTCFLEYSDDKVNVTDLLYANENGKWIQKVSSYQKVRISESKIKEILSAQGFKIESCEIINRLVYIIASKN
jgi:2-polyprenyl-3-methyl-5-hydroxy-6-metoxy-1,4-benzoquinol methylase